MDWGSLAEWLTVLVTVPTLIYALVQLRSARDAVIASREATQAETRPYVWAAFHESRNQHDQLGVRLCIANSGRTPALDVVIDFDESTAAWREPGVASEFTFLPEGGGIRMLAPGADYRYYVGAWRKDAPLHRVWKERDVTEGTISYRTLDGRRISERFALSLRDLAGTGELKAPQ